MEAPEEAKDAPGTHDKPADDYAFAAKVGMAVVTAGCLWAERSAIEIAAVLAVGIGTIAALRLSQLVAIGRDMRERLDSIVVKRPGQAGKATAPKQDGGESLMAAPNSSKRRS